MVKPKKHFGQHFLKDLNIAQKIVSLLQSSEDTPILEIGPGTGILTKLLIQQKPLLHVVEIDPEAVNFLKRQFTALHQENRLWEGDFLKLDLASKFSAKIAIIGNFPYNISSQILFKILENRHIVEEVVCMLQKEVAQRIASPPGSKEYGILSVLLQSYYQVSYHFTVPESAFFPPPKVKSGIIHLQRNQTEKLPCNEQLFFEVVKTAFNQRRKTLRNALKKFFKDNNLAESIFQKRAEQLSVNEFITITQKIQEQS